MTTIRVRLYVAPTRDREEIQVSIYSAVCGVGVGIELEFGGHWTPGNHLIFLG